MIQMLRKIKLKFNVGQINSLGPFIVFGVYKTKDNK